MGGRKGIGGGGEVPVDYGAFGATGDEDGVDGVPGYRCVRVVGLVGGGEGEREGGAYSRLLSCGL